MVLGPNSTNADVDLRRKKALDRVIKFVDDEIAEEAGVPEQVGLEIGLDFCMPSPTAGPNGDVQMVSHAWILANLVKLYQKQGGWKFVTIFYNHFEGCLHVDYEPYLYLSDTSPLHSKKHKVWPHTYNKEYSLGSKIIFE